MESESLEPRILLTHTNPNASPTVGVYDENSIDPNTVDFVAAGSSFSDTEFAARVAAAFADNRGGVIDGSILGAFYRFGEEHTKVLTINAGIGIGTGHHISGTGGFATSGSTNFTTVNFGGIDGAAPGEAVVAVGVTALSISGRNYGDVTVTARLASGGTLRATRAISAGTGQGDTFYGFEAPQGDSITGFTLQYSGPVNGTPDTRLWFDDIGFITAVPGTANQPPVAANDQYAVAEDGALVVPAPVGPVLRYGFDEASTGSGPALDSGSIPPANATLVNGATRTGNTPGNNSLGALDLTKQDPKGTYATAGDVEKIDALDEMTVTLWVNLREAAQDNDVLLSDLPTFNDPVGSSGWDLTFANFGGQILPTFAVYERASSSIRGAGKIITAFDADQTWSFIAMTYSANNVLSTYLGSEDAAVTLDGRTLAGIPLTGNNSPLTIGRSSTQMSDFDSAPPAWIDDVRIYDHPLTLEELQAVRNEALTADGGVLENDSDPDGDTLMAELVSGPAHGDLTFNANGSFSYLPDPDFHGTDSFTYRATDGTLDSAPATVSITVTPVNDDPVAGDDTASTTDNAPVIIAVLSNDSDVDGGSLTIQSVAQGAHGTVVINPDGTVTYTPSGDFAGTDTFAYTVADGSGGTDVGTVAVSVLPRLFISDASIVEGNSGTTQAQFTVTLSNASTETITVVGDTADGTATAGADYTAVIGSTLTFAPGVTSLPFVVTGRSDTVDEPNETFFVNLSNPTNADIADPQAVGTILDDDLPEVALSLEGSPLAEAGGVATVTARLSSVHDQDVTVGLNLAGTAGGSDYASSGTEIVIAAGSLSGSITLTSNDDALDESDETILVEISGVTNGTIGDVAEVTAAITDDDEPPTISIDDVTVAEGDIGTAQMRFTVSLSAPSGKTVTVIGDTADGTATAGEDYSAVAGSVLIFAPGETSKSFVVLVNGDADPEQDETLSVNLTNPINVTIADGQGVGTIVSDDAPPAPIANDDAVATDEDVPLVIDLLANDAGAGSLTASIVTGPANGTLKANPDGSFTYTPAANFNGADSFTYTASDGTADSNLATATITVNAVNDAPTISVPGAQTTAEDVPVVISGISVADGDVNEGTGTVRVTLAVDSGKLKVSTHVAGGLSASQVLGNKSDTVTLEGMIDAVNRTLAAGVTYQGRVNFDGTDTLTVTASDLGNTGSGGPQTATETVTIRVLSPGEQIANLIEAIERLRADGVLNKGQANALIVKLEHVEKKLDRGQEESALNQLEAFTNQVKSFIRADLLTREQGQTLLDAADDLETSIETTAKHRHHQAFAFEDFLDALFCLFAKRWKH